MKSKIEHYLHKKTINNQHNSNNTTRTYRNMLVSWFDYSDGDINKAENYLYYLVNVVKKDSKQINTILTILANFYDEQSDIDINPFRKLVSNYHVDKRERAIKKIQRDERTLSDFEVQAMLRHAKNKTHEHDPAKDPVKFYISFRNYFILKMFSEFGMRISSLVGIDTSDISLRKRKILIRITKNKVPYVLPIIKVYDELMDYLDIANNHMDNVRKDNMALFLNYQGNRISADAVRSVINSIAQDCGLYEPQRSTHQLRHYRATQFYKEGMRIDMISCIMGVSEPILKETYLHITHDDVIMEYEKWYKGLDKHFKCPECGYDSRSGKTKAIKAVK